VAKLHLSATGTARVRGVLGDSTPFAARSFLSSDGRIPVFAPLYHHRGGIFAWLNVTNGAVQGSARWMRPADSRSQNFPDGFQLEVPVRGLSDNNDRTRSASLFLPQRDVICGPRLRLSIPLPSKNLLSSASGSPLD